MIGVRDFLVWVHRVAVAGQRGDADPVLVDGLLELLDELGMLHKFYGVRVGSARGAAAADLDLLNAEALEILEGLIQGKIAQKNRHYT